MTQEIETQPNGKRRKYNKRRKMERIDGPLKTDEAQLVRDLAGILCTNDEICHILKMDREVLELKYTQVLRNARASGKSSIRRLQMRVAREGNAPMLMFLGRVLLNQREDTAKESPKFNIIVNGIPKDQSTTSDDDESE